MLKITIPATELFDEKTQTFITVKEQPLTLEHSLLSLSKWESKWHKPFLGKEAKTFEQQLDYIRCMTITQNVDPSAYYALTQEQLKKIDDYIQDPMTATWFNDKNQPKNGKEVITAEIIYYWMKSLQIPFDCEKWHLNRLLTFIRVCNIKDAPEKKMSKREIYSRNRALNDARRKKYNTTG